MGTMECGDPAMIFAGYPVEMKEFLNANPGLNSRIKYKFTIPDYSVQEMATILDNGIMESGYCYDGRTPHVEILEKETTMTIRSQQNGRLVKNILVEAIINLRNRLSFTAGNDRLLTVQENDVTAACQA